MNKKLSGLFFFIAIYCVEKHKNKQLKNTKTEHFTNRQRLNRSNNQSTVLPKRSARPS